MGRNPAGLVRARGPAPFFLAELGVPACVLAFVIPCVPAFVIPCVIAHGGWPPLSDLRFTELVLAAGFRPRSLLPPPVFLGVEAIPAGGSDGGVWE